MATAGVKRIENLGAQLQHQRLEHPPQLPHAGEAPTNDFTFPRPNIGRYKIIQKIGSGGFGAIYKVFDPISNTFLAAKILLGLLRPSYNKLRPSGPGVYHAEKRMGKSYLDKEVQFYKRLNGTNSHGVPRCHWFGNDGQFKIAVFELMGPSLSDLFHNCHRKFTLKTVLMLANQLITLLECIHNCGIVHRDVKPGNFVMGINDTARNVHVIDFGLSNLWRQSNGSHIPFSTECAFRGTHRYASINSHFKKEQSRRDDLEALGYVLIYFLKGGLPWQSLKVARHKRRKHIGRNKEAHSVAELTKDLPSEFGEFLEYVKALQFDQEPDYHFLKNLFKQCFARHRFEWDFVFDWTQPKDSTNNSSSASVSEEVVELTASNSNIRPPSTPLSTQPTLVNLAPSEVAAGFRWQPSTSIATAGIGASVVSSSASISALRHSQSSVPAPPFRTAITTLHTKPIGHSYLAASSPAVVVSTPRNVSDIISISSDDSGLPATRGPALPARVRITPSLAYPGIEVDSPLLPQPPPASPMSTISFVDLAEEPASPPGAVVPPSACSTPAVFTSSPTRVAVAPLSWSASVFSVASPPSPPSAGGSAVPMAVESIPTTAPLPDLLIVDASLPSDTKPTKKRKRGVAEQCNPTLPVDNPCTEIAPKRRSVRLQEKQKTE